MGIFKKMLRVRSARVVGRAGNWKLERENGTIEDQSYKKSFDRTVQDSLTKIGGDHNEEN